MTIAAMNWSQVERYLETDDRAVVPLGSTEQHAGLSLSVDSILSERVATEAAGPLGASSSSTATAATPPPARSRSSGWPTTPARR